MDERIVFGTIDRLMLVRADTGVEQTLVTRTEGSHAPLEPLNWSPDGRYLAFFTGPGRGIC